MRKIQLLVSALFIAMSMISCNEFPWDNVNDLEVDATLINKIPKVYPGGNVACSQLGDFSLDQTTGRNNYVPLTNGFENTWPAGLVVKVDEGKYVSFAIDGSLIINGKCYKVGAVIVKGSDASNVYDYTDLGGVTGDKNLTTPNNASGGTAGLSNLTFCFVEGECEPQPELVIALKTIMTSVEIPWAYAVSGGQALPNNDIFIGYNYFISDIENTYPLIYGFGSGNDQLGTISAKDYIENNIHYLEVVIDTYNDDWSFVESYLYVGTLDGLKKYQQLYPENGLYYLNYEVFPFFKNDVTGKRIFKIPFNEITQ